MNSFLQDLRYGLRSLAHSPGFAAAAILTLALGVGANTAIFSVLGAVVLRDLPYQDAHRITVMWTKNIPALVGLGVGLLGSLALSRTLSTFLYETNALDPAIYLGVTALLLAVTVVACLLPARRAARFDPVAALRGE
jgi:hypothetical protein